MKKTLLKLTGLTAFIALAVLVLGCSNPAEGGDGDPSAEAAQLAAAINNRPKSSPGDLGRAEANGSTVTLKGGFIDIRTNLTVSAGVTLDVTADGHLGLHDMILTVNGTANVNSNRIRLEDTATYGTINGSGTIHLKGKGPLLQVEGSKKNVHDRKLTLDGVTLVGVADNDSSLVVVRSGGEGCSGEFIMKSGAITGNTHTSNDWADGGGVRVEEGGRFTMEGGEISGNTASGDDGAGGGGVNVHKGTFTMQGGVISGNTATGASNVSIGGGVMMDDGSTFTMQGGEISGNSAINTNGRAEGGGVKLENGVTFTMINGTISGNTATSANGYAQGGGVRINGDVIFTMTSGTISDNRAISANNDADSGGVFIGNGTFTMSGGTISGNTAKGGNHASGGGMRVDSGATFKMQGGAIITGNTAESSGYAEGGGVQVRGEGSAFTIEGGRIQGNTDSDGFTKNTASSYAALRVDSPGSTAKWGTGGTYTKGGVDQSGGGNIGSTDDTLIATPAP
jgi:hypothetical protein